MMTCLALVDKYDAMVPASGSRDTPGRGKFTVEEYRAVEFYGLQHFRQHIHDISLGESGRSAKNSGRSDKRTAA